MFSFVNINSGECYRYRKSIFFGPGYISKYGLKIEDEICLDELPDISVPYQCHRNDCPIKYRVTFDMLLLKYKNRLVEEEAKEKVEEENIKDKEEVVEKEIIKEVIKEVVKEDPKEKQEQELTEFQKKKIINLQLQYEEVIIVDNTAFCTNYNIIIKKGNTKTIIKKKTETVRI